MEKKCILPKTEVTKIFEQEPAVLSSLLRFCECTKDELFNVFKLRNTYARKDQSPDAPKDKKEEIYRYGYSQFQHKEGTKIRSLQKPYKSLANIQNVLLKRLSYVPTSLASMAGKVGDSPEKNAELHKPNPYLITMDIKNAYPSIDTQRVRRNLEAGLDRPLSTWCPQIKTKEQKELFIKAITHLCVSDNQLPQGASTSNQIQNIVMRKVDTKIEMKLDERELEGPVYSRYADDIALSFSEFQTKGVLAKKLKKYITELKNNENNQEEIRKIMQSLWLDFFSITEPDESSLFTEYMEIFRTFIQTNSVLSEEEKEDCLWKIELTMQHRDFGINRDIAVIKDDLLEILGSEGRVLNPKKTKIRTPHSNTDREINGIRFNGQGERTITKKKLAEYTRLFNDLLEKSVEELASNPFYRGKYKIKLNEEGCLAETRITILNSIKGVYTRMKNIYGESKIPKDMFLLYTVVDLKWENYDDWINNKSFYKGFLKRPPKKVSGYKKTLADMMSQQPSVEEPRVPLGTYLKSFEKEILEDPKDDFREAFSDQNIIGHRTISNEELLRDEIGEPEGGLSEDNPLSVVEEGGEPPLAKGELPF